MFDPVGELSKHANIIRQVQQLIRDHHLLPGDRLPPERELALQFKVNRAVVREALRTLASLRILEIRPQSGIYVLDVDTEASIESMVLQKLVGIGFSPEEVGAILEVRRVLEGFAVRTACQRASAADLEQIEHILADAADHVGGSGEFERCDRQFHLAIARASHNPILTRLLHTLQIMSYDRRRRYFADPSRCLESHRFHLRIIEALSERDGEKAWRLTEEHLQEAEQYWRLELEPKPPAPHPAAGGAVS